MTNIEEYMPVVRKIALSIIQKLPPMVELDDLVQCGSIGLMDAAKRFDPTKNVEFVNYAKHRIRGAIIDHLRDMDNGIKEISVHVMDTEEESVVDGLADAGPSPEHMVAEEERKAFVRRLVNQLSPRRRQIIEMYYFGEMTMRDIGGRIGIGESRVSQISQRAHEDMRTMVRNVVV